MIGDGRNGLTFVAMQIKIEKSILLLEKSSNLNGISLRRVSPSFKIAGFLHNRSCVRSKVFNELNL